MSPRLDAELVRRGLAQSRERAKEYIKNGSVSVNGEFAAKPSEEVFESDSIILNGKTLKYVGRGGLKLERAIEVFELRFDGRVCLDIGASTGGFTDCMLQNGASMVYATDVGHGQLVQKLRDDPRVVCMEGVNVKDFTADMFPIRPDFVCADLSFITVKYAAAFAAEILLEGGEAVMLIKPQFEAGKSNISKGGIVKDRGVHAEVLRNLCEYFSSLYFSVRGLIPSPIKGGDGNTEYLCYLVKQNYLTPVAISYRSVVERAFSCKR